VLARHQLEDDARFAVFAGAENDALIRPLHWSCPPRAKGDPENPM
jgi:hypothetical protein